MSRWTLVGCALACGLTFAPGPARGDWMWKPETGWMQPNRKPRDSALLRYEQALASLTRGAGKGAVRELQELIEKHPKADWIEDAYFHIGEAYYQAKYYMKAAAAFENYLNKYPGGKRAEDALERLLTIGETLSKKLHRMGPAVDVLEKVIAKGAGSGLADDASAAVGDAYFRAGYYDEAVAAYRDLVERFPSSEWVQSAPFKIGLCYMNAGASVDINPEAYANARASFERYVRLYPDGIHVAEAKRLIEKAKAFQARSEYRIAAFYVRTRRPRSAAVYLRSLLREFPHTDYARRAEALLARLERLGVIP